MSKRLVLVFCALFVLASAVPAFAAVQNIKVSGDILARSITRNNFDLNNGDSVTGEDEIQTVNSVVRLRVDADLTDNVQTVLRLINERDWDDNGTTNSDIDLDLAYVTLKEFFCSPLSLTIGRQELHFGNDMIIGDGVGGDPTGFVTAGGVGTNQSTNYTEAVGYTDSVNGDLAYRKAFDAVRATLNYDPLVIDVVVAKVQEGDVVGVETSDDIDVYGINAGYKFDDKWNTSAESYFWGKLAMNTGSRTDETYTLGGRVSTNPTQKLNLQQEVAHQAGRRFIGGDVLRDRDAWASQTIATFVPGWRHNPVLGMAYSYFSGDADIADTDPDKDYHQWDPMFENQTSGHIINALFPQSNCHNVNLSLKLTPDFVEDVTLKAEWIYQAMAKALNEDGTQTSDYSTQSFRANKKELGQEFDLTITYDYTEDVQFGLLTAWFMPGRAFTETTATQSREAAAEAIVSCKVGF